MKQSWKNVAGLLVYPHFKKKQKIRTHKKGDYEGWIPDLEDPVTLHFFLGLLIEQGTEIVKIEETYKLDGEEMTKEQLKEWIFSAFLEEE